VKKTFSNLDRKPFSVKAEVLIPNNIM